MAAKPEMTLANVPPTQNLRIHLSTGIYSKGFALKLTTLEPNVGRVERWRRSLPVGGHVGPKLVQIVHFALSNEDQRKANVEDWVSCFLWFALPPPLSAGDKFDPTSFFQGSKFPRSEQHHAWRPGKV